MSRSIAAQKRRRGILQEARIQLVFFTVVSDNPTQSQFENSNKNIIAMVQQSMGIWRRQEWRTMPLCGFDKPILKRYSLLSS
jgi:hypothetical protein